MGFNAYLNGSGSIALEGNNNIRGQSRVGMRAEIDYYGILDMNYHIKAL